MTSRNTVVLLTNKEDITCDFIVRELRAKDIPFFRINTDTWADESNISLAFPGNKATGIFSFFAKAKAVYFRRPVLPALSGIVDDPSMALYCQAEWKALQHSIYACFQKSCLWINHPFHIQVAENKPYQLQIAEECGFLIPDTRITNSKLQVDELSAIHKALIVKPLKNAIIPGNNGEQVVFSQKITKESHISQESLRISPIIVQQWIDKAYDLRVTVVGDRVFSVKIDSQLSSETSIDWRAGGDTVPPHTVYALPEELADKCLSLTRHLDLHFGAIDLVRDRNGCYWFLEINPNGQWAWIENQTGLPLTDSIVSLLINGERYHEHR